jgi:4-hydroxythreonine-4-phosphate dehydrogenase
LKPYADESAPLVALTLGDPTGVGPEVIAGAWRDPRLGAACRAFVVGHPAIVERALRLVGSSARVEVIDAPEAARPASDVVPCLMAGSDEAAQAPPCRVDARGGAAAYQYLCTATQLALAGRIDALVTAPLHKEALHAAGRTEPGHTEILASLCGVDDYAMMLYLPPGDEVRGPYGLGVAHVTLHTALRNVFHELSIDAVAAKAGLAHAMMRRLGAGSPRIGVLALNPHAGEGGLFGDEESRIIRPGVERARELGIDASGPHAADMLFGRARDGEFDAVVAMYHDQGHIALKLMGWRRAVNVTLGLPIVRTSVAHGTAFDRAWRGVAETTSMVEAVLVAARLAPSRAMLKSAVGDA